MNYLFDNYELDTLRFELRLRGELCRLQPKPLDLLVYLIENRSRVVLKSELLAHLWPGVCVTENALAQAIAALRDALSECGPSAVTCVRSRGYRFTRSVIEATQQDAVVAPPPSAITTRSAPPPARAVAGACVRCQRALA